LGKAKAEQSIFWHDEFTQVLLKCRPDAWAPTMIIDLKTTNDASPDSIRRDMASYGYHIQAAMIIDGIQAVANETITDFVLLAIEKKPPYAIGTYPIGKEAIEVGRTEYLDLVNCYKRHEENNDWPSYQEMTLNLPKYY
jgi:exodeoxyribonuclease VIII